MNFLKKLAGYMTQGMQILGVFGPIASGISPKVAGVVTTVEDSLTKVATVVVSMENVRAVLTDKALTGADMAKAAAPQAAQILLQCELFAGKKIDDDKKALFVQKSGELAGVLSDLLNCLHVDNVKV